MDDVCAITSGVPVDRIFALTDAVAVGDMKSVMRYYSDLSKLRTDGSLSPVLSSMLTRHFRILLNAKDLRASGLSDFDTGKKLGIFSTYAAQYFRQGAIFRRETLVRMLDMIAESTSSSRMGLIDDRISTEVLLTELCTLSAKSKKR